MESLEQKLNAEDLSKEFVFRCYCSGCTIFFLTSLAFLIIILVTGSCMVYRRALMQEVGWSDIQEHSPVVQETRM